MYDYVTISDTQRVLRLLHEKPDIGDYMSDGTTWSDYVDAKDEYEECAVDMYDMVCDLAEEFGAVMIRPVIATRYLRKVWYVVHPSLRGHEWQCTMFDEEGPVGDVQVDKPCDLWDYISSDYIMVDWAA